MRDDNVYLGHMLDTARKICAKSAGLERARFDADEDLRLALLHLVQIVGEAAGRVSAQTRAAHPEILWHKITGMRHKIVHDYMDISENALWQVVTEDLAPLVAALEKIVPPETP
jgi:uncharacterized protein with HEPN domain